MHPALQRQLDALIERAEEVAALLAEPELGADPQRFQALSREYGQLEPVTRLWQRCTALRQRRQEALALLADPDMAELAALDQAEAEDELERTEAELQRLLLPRDPFDDHGLFLEIRAGTGGDEAAIFAGDLLRMYARYAERQGWQLELLSESHGEHGGYKEVIARIEARPGQTGAYSRLKFESGAHRVQRVPETEAQGRIHTSAATVAVLPELNDSEAAAINPAELRIDTYRASGAGGQHVNKTESAIRITHLPTGLVVECQDERSQHKNRARAMALLQARLADIERTQRQNAQAAERKRLVGSGDRSERIRTYNVPQGRVTDHRINLTLYRLDEFLQGDLDPILEPLAQAHQADLLAELGQGGG